MQALNREYAPTRDRLAMRGDERSPTLRMPSNKARIVKSPCAICKTSYVLDKDDHVTYLCDSCLAFSAYRKTLLKEEKKVGESE